MQLLIIALLGLLSFDVKAFDVTAYNNVQHCDATDDTMYRIISGASDGACYTFDDPMWPTGCEQFNKGGWEKGPCTGESLLPISILQQNRFSSCTYWSEGGCSGGTSFETVQTVENGEPLPYCINGPSYGMDNIKSFSCRWDDTVDILGTVGCHDAVSTNVCVNDCNCYCNGQILLCPPKSLKCTPESYILCEKYCNCVNP